MHVGRLTKRQQRSTNSLTGCSVGHTLIGSIIFDSIQPINKNSTTAIYKTNLIVTIATEQAS